MISLVVLSILIILGPGLHFEAQSFAQPHTPNVCCFSYFSGPIRNVVACYETSPFCPMPGVIVITPSGKLVCVHPGDAEKYCKDLQPREIPNIFKKDLSLRLYDANNPYLGEEHE